MYQLIFISIIILRYSHCVVGLWPVKNSSEMYWNKIFRNILILCLVIHGNSYKQYSDHKNFLIYNTVHTEIVTFLKKDTIHNVICENKIRRKKYILFNFINLKYTTIIIYFSLFSIISLWVECCVFKKTLFTLCFI